MRRLILCLLILAFASPALAQTPATPGSTLKWEMNEADADDLEYEVDVDDDLFMTVVGHVCTPSATAPPPLHECQAPTPAMTPGQHVLMVRGVRITEGVRFEGLPSTPLDIVFAALPSAPQNFRIE